MRRQHIERTAELESFVLSTLAFTRVRTDTLKSQLKLVVHGKSIAVLLSISGNHRADDTVPIGSWPDAL